MKVSIIIPAYNCADYINRTIDSIFAQTYPRTNLEVIIVNDGSTDETANILSNYEHEFTIIHTKNKGVSAARNEGLKYSTGEFIQFLDSDDILLPNKIEEQVNILKENNADVAYGIWQKFVETDGDIKITQTIDRKIKGDIEIALFSDYWYPPASILYSRRIVEKVGGFKLWLEMVEDARFLLDAAIMGAKFFYVPKPTALYRIGNENSLSQINELKFVHCCFKNAVSVCDLWKEQFVNHPQKKDAVINCLRYCINRFSVLNETYFNIAISQLLEIDPNYIPTQKGLLQISSKILGYRNAERIASFKRRLLK